MINLKTKYAIKVIIAVITILVISPIFILYSSLAIQEDFIKNITYHDISSKLSNIKSFIANAELPGDKEVVTNIRKTVENALNAWDECQKLVNSKEINLQHKSGELYIVNYEDKSKRIFFDISLVTKEGKIKSCRKRVLPTGAGNNETGNILYILNFNDNDFSINRYINQNEEVYFNPSGSIACVVYKTPDGKRYAITWSENGSIVTQGINKINNNTLSIEAERQAKLKLKEFQEKAQKEYDEYQKGINSEKIDSNNY